MLYGLGNVKMHDKIKVLIDQINVKKEQLDSFGVLSKDLVKSMGDWLRVELTYTSNAIEGNTLTRQETALVVEDGITPGGKNLVEILEAKNHDKALSFVIELSQNKKITELSQSDILDIHELVLVGINTDNAGKYRTSNVRIAGSQTILPNYMKVSQLMKDLEGWLHSDTGDLLLLACDLHYKFVRIHPFVDGNGRTGRLLFNLILLVAGYPLSFIETKEIGKYLASLSNLDNYDDSFGYYKIMLSSVERSLDLYLDQLQASNKIQDLSEKLLKIGELSKLTGETSSSIRYWTKLGLLPVIHKGTGNYAYYNSRAISICKRIRQLQETKRYSLDEIKKILVN